MVYWDTMNKTMVKEPNMVTRVEARKVLVAYLSQTGNTKWVAEAIYYAIPEPKEIKPIKEMSTLEGYDLSFLGLPMHGLARAICKAF
jgi:hypothetical protein